MLPIKDVYNLIFERLLEPKKILIYNFNDFEYFYWEWIFLRPKLLRPMPTYTVIWTNNYLTTMILYVAIEPLL